ncbi:ribosomal protein S30-domain-containing protein [Boletus reticuloceps]|uniref:Ribosomal protein S30-domain-containing protein n=2 Tax=Boletus TaxID=5369 RepID=A0A8I3AFE4_9AGAM|nr:ribosomal protein S30-domain-containing protein [Boletus reticuloceps]
MITSELYSYSTRIDTIKVELPIVDNMGKVHGSLARAGKVKAQTPKVEKQEKKKNPRGRAKKRMLYNRRFVNVTTLPGGKRRMNPNPEK